MKKLLSLLLAVALLFSLCSSMVYAEDGTGREYDSGQQSKVPKFTFANVAPTVEPPPPDLPLGWVTGFANEGVFADLTREAFGKGKLEFLYQFQSQITNNLACTIRLQNGETIYGACTATWNTDSVDLDKAGDHDLIATLIPPKGYAFAQGVRTTVVYPVRILDPEHPIDIVKLETWNPYACAPAIAVGAPPEALTEQYYFDGSVLTGYSNQDVEHQLLTQWDFSEVNLNRTGSYRVRGKLIAPPGTTFAEGLTVPELYVMVSVQQPEVPQINNFYLQPGELCFPFVSLPCAEEDASAWMSVNDEPWVQLAGDDLATDATVLKVGIHLFENGNTYRLQMDYPGGQTGIVTFKMGDVLDFISYIDGDRDGDDVDGVTPPGLGQPPPGGGNTLPPPTPTPDPTPPSKPNPTPKPTPPVADGNPTGSSAPAQSGGQQPPAIEVIAPAPAQTEKPAFLEESDATSTTLSGARLRLMLAEETGARFSKQEINVTMSAEAVAALGISDEDVVTVQILRESDTVFFFGVTVNEQNVTSLMGTSISLPYTPSSETPILFLQNDKAEIVSSGSYAPQSGIATFLVDVPDKYTILDKAVPAGAAPEDSETATPKAVPILPIGIAAVTLLLLGGGVFFLKRRWHK